MYVVNRIAGKVTGVRRLADNADVPIDVGNADYRAFLAWNAQQSPPLSLSDVFDLAAYKAARVAEIDARTEALDAQGVEFPAGSGRRYSLLPAAMPRWLGLIMSRDLLPYPVTIGTTDARAGSLASADEVLAFYAAGLARESYVSQAGAGLKAAVMAAADKAAVDAVVDDRS